MEFCLVVNKLDVRDADNDSALLPLPSIADSAPVLEEDNPSSDRVGLVVAVTVAVAVVEGTVSVMTSFVMECKSLYNASVAVLMMRDKGAVRSVPSDGFTDKSRRV